MMDERCGAVNPMSQMKCFREQDHHGDHGDVLGRHWSVRTNVVARSDYEDVVAERDTLAAEVQRLRSESPYLTCGCGRQIHISATADLVAMRERARALLANPDEDEAWKHAAQHIIGEA